MQLFHTPAATSAVFDDPNLIGSAGLVPILRLAETADLAALADAHLSVPSDKGAHAGAKVSHVETEAAATHALRNGQGADLLLVDCNLDIAALIAANEGERIRVPVVAVA